MANSEHGIADAAYASNGERYMPVMICLCGFSTGRCDSWEQAGVALDDHLTEVPDPPKKATP